MKFLEHIAINPEVKLIKGNIYPFIDMASVSTKSREPDHIGEKVFTSGIKFQKGDTVIARIEPCLQNGKRFYCKNIEKGFGSTEYLVFRPKDKKINNLYLYYFMQQDFIKQKMIKSMSGATGRQRVNNAVFNELEISLPPLETQQKIASILSAYDDLIENNRRQIKLLEEAAQRLYEEWFVDLRFPGHENVKVIDGVPEGWEKKSMEEIADYLNGFAFKPSDWGTIGRPIIKIKELNEGITKNTPRNTGEDIPSKYYISSGDLIFSWSATLTAKIWDAEDGILNQHLFKVTPHAGIAREYLLQSILYTLKEFQNLTTGSTMKHIQRGKLSQVFVKVPADEIMKRYNKSVDNIREKILSSNHMVTFLQEARDRLLPKLMSGEIKV